MSGSRAADGTPPNGGTEHGASGRDDKPSDLAISRRAFLTAGVAGCVTLAAGAAYGGTAFTTFDLELVEKTIPVRNLPRDLHSYRIAFLTDLHLGPSLPSELIAEAVRMTNEHKPDLVLLGGDYIWFADSPLGHLFSIWRNRELRGASGKALATEIFRLLGKLLSGLHATDGIYAVLGNHDRWVDPVSCVRELSTNGIEFLTNVTKDIRRGAATLKLSGTDDFWTGIPDVRLPTQRGPLESRLVLTHNPDYLSHLMVNRDLDFDLGLAGHTHGGQIKLPLLGALKYNVMDRRLSEGHFNDGRRNIYTSRGVGVIEIPYRVNCRPEVSVLTLTPA